MTRVIRMVEIAAHNEKWFQILGPPCLGTLPAVAEALATMVRSIPFQASAANEAAALPTERLTSVNTTVALVLARTRPAAESDSSPVRAITPDTLRKMAGATGLPNNKAAKAKWVQDGCMTKR